MTLGMTTRVTAGTDTPQNTHSPSRPTEGQDLLTYLVGSLTFGQSFLLLSPGVGVWF